MELNLQNKINQAHSTASTNFSDAFVEFESIYSIFKNHSAKNKKTIFYSYFEENHKTANYTFQEFDDKVVQFSQYFESIGLKRGDRIATAGYNHPDPVLVYLAAWKIGLCVVPLNMGEDDNRLKYILSNSNPKLVVALEKEYQKIRILCPEQEIVLNTELHLFQGNPEDTLSKVKLSDSEALLIYTSGTTGNPKGVILTQYNLVVDANSITKWFGITSKDIVMCVLPIHHVNGAVVTHVAPFISGASVVLVKKFSANHFFEIAKKENVTVSSVVPTLLQFLVQSEFQSGKIQTELRFLICGAGPLTVELAMNFENKFGIPVMHGYGLSETTCYSCFLPADLTHNEHKRWLGEFGFPSIGISIPSNEMDIQDDSGKSLNENERGEIVIRGHNVMKEYYDNEDANKKAFEFGWFRSGDEGFFRFDEQGRKFFFITGRFKELIIRGGINLSPLEIDEVINKCPGVKAGISVAFENDWYGEEVGAFVQKSDQNVTEADIILFCKKKLPFMKQPKAIVFGDSIPVTSTGKFQRNKVKHLFSEWKTVQFKEMEKIKTK